MSKPFFLLLACLAAGAGAYYQLYVAGVEPKPSACAERCVVELGATSVRLGEGRLLAGLPGEGALTVEQIAAWLDDPANHRELDPELPIGLDGGAADMRGLADNPLTRAKIELGRQLFFDARLSVDGTVSCAGCHKPDHGYAGSTRFGVGVRDQRGTRNAPSAANRILSDAQFRDGRAASLEEQALGPIENPLEMGSSHDAAVQTLRSIEGYRLQFQRLFPGEATIDAVGLAIAAFERALVSGPSAWDHDQRLRTYEDYYDGELDLLDQAERVEYAALQSAAAAAPLSDAARRGGLLFFGDRAACSRCHAGANFTDERYHNVGVGMDSGEADDLGRFVVTGQDADRGAFKTPSLRNVAQTAPYMHDGSIDTLTQVVALYVEGGRDNPHLSPLLEPLDLNEQEQQDLVAFLEALTGEWPQVATGRLPE